MAKMLRPFKSENVIGDFSPGTTFREDGAEDAAVRMGVDARPYFDVRSHSGTWTRFHVDYTIGSKWQQGYATKLPDGSFQVLPIEYNRVQKSWVNYWEMIDPSGSQRAVIADFPELRAATNYQENCAVCHTSQLRAAIDSPTPMQHAIFREGGVDCEMCHGPSALHIKQMRSSGVNAKPTLEPPVDFRRINNKDGVRICAQCHAQTAVREIGSGGEMNYSIETSYVPRSWGRNYDEYSRRAFYKDGRFRETTFLVEAFTRSACYRRGDAQCATCHAPHVDDFSANLASLKNHDEPNEMCLKCHGQIRTKLAQHTHHKINSEASQCVSCHMPRIVNALLFKARSHEIAVPTADLTERFGQSESPNACLLCHIEKDARWAQEQLRAW
jgi:predicted CXXCH cytochrome family protein